MLRKDTELWDKIQSPIIKISDKPSDYDKKYIKIKSNPDDNLSLNKILRLQNLTINVRSVFQGNNRYYSQHIF